MTPVASPDPAKHPDWSYPDTEDGILRALKQGATHLWANTILFATHPLQTSTKIGEFAANVKIIGQPPCLVEQYDDKEYVNDMLRATGRFTLPRAWTLTKSDDVPDRIKSLELPFPIVGKPIRGRGSHGVKVCRNENELLTHAKALFEESPSIMLEEYLSGEEATVTVIPPTSANPEYRSLFVVSRFNHADGIAPYNGVVAVTANSRAIMHEEYENDPHYQEVSRHCAEVAKLLKATAPIRIDVRRFTPGSNFALFDVNVKPNMTGPGRPGRDDQACLSALAAAPLGWDYPKLLEQMLQGAVSLKEMRAVEVPRQK